MTTVVFTFKQSLDYYIAKCTTTSGFVIVMYATRTTVFLCGNCKTHPTILHIYVTFYSPAITTPLLYP